MANTKQKTEKQKVPRFQSREEEADFWDKHSPLDFPGYWVEAKRPTKFDKPLGHILGVRLDAETIGQLRAIGRSRGLRASTLARMWLLERLVKEAKSEGP